MKRFFQNIKNYNRYALYVARATMESDYSSSYLDRIWLVLEPFLEMIVYVIVFGYIFNAKEDHFAAFIFLGLLLFTFFNKMVTGAVRIVRSNRAIVTKVYIPKYILMVTLLYESCYRLLYGLMIEVILMIFFRIVPNWRVIEIIPYFISFALFSLGCSLILLHFGVFVSDLSFVITVVLRFLMYLSGIFYSIENRMPGTIGYLLSRLNPIAFYITAIRNLLLYGHGLSAVWLGIWTMISLILITIGVHLIHKYESNYAKVI